MKFLFKIILISFFLFSGCQFNTQTNSKNKISASIFPLFDITRNIAGADFQTTLLLKPGASPHTFEPTPAEVKDLADSRVLFVIGQNLDNWAARIASAAGVAEVVAVDKNIKLRKITAAQDHRREKENFDPHYWTTPKNAGLIARQIKNELSRIFPEKALQFQKNFLNYQKELLALDAEIKEKLKKLKNKKIATFHESFGYLADEYGLKLVAVFEPFAGKEPTPGYLEELSRKIKESGTPVIFGEPQFSLKLIESLAEDLKIKISVLDPIGGSVGRDSYLKLMRYNLSQLAEALQ